MAKDVRPSAVRLVVYRLYSRVMYMLTETACNRLVSAQLAFRKCHQAHEVVFILRQLVEKAVEWRAPHVYIMDGDINKAYDHTSHCAFALAARAMGHPRGAHSRLATGMAADDKHLQATHGSDQRRSDPHSEFTPG